MNIYAVTRKGKNKKESDDRIVMDDNILRACVHRRFKSVAA